MWEETLVVGAVGITGIAGTFAAPYRVEQRLARRREGREFRRARRLVLEELETLILQLEIFIDQARAPTEATYGDLFPTEQWEANKAVLAESLPDAAWDPMPRFFHTLPKARLLISRLAPGAALDAHSLELLADSVSFARAISHDLETCNAPLSD